jgi:signal transduction histidine kinase
MTRPDIRHGIHRRAMTPDILPFTADAEPELRILHVEDDPNDAELIRLALEADGLRVRPERVTSGDELIAALERGGFDLILSDFALPGFDGLSALRICQQRAPSVPFILVSGQIGEEAAVDGVRGGATDYVLKHRLSRLGPSVRRALAESAERRKRRIAEEALRQSEAQLRQSQKMEAVGRLAGGVAHDFNNLLTAILGYSQLMEVHLEAGSVVRRDLGEIVRAAERAASLTRQLLAFSRQQILQPRILDLNGVITETDRMLRRLIGDDIDLLTVPDPALGPTKADPGQIEQVLVNLAVNARDAMPHGGKITIETANVDLDAFSVGGSRQAAPGPYVMLAVSDTGCGMDPETASRVFEPFFTTKEPGQGTGLGLSMVHGIVHQSGGTIDVYSAPGRGTTFKVYLPRVAATEAVDETPEPRVEETPRGSETILLIDDDSLVRGVVSETLRRSGYEVIEASNRDEASEACAACDREGRAIDLLLSDVIMPGMSILEFTERLQGRHPEMRQMFMSGYTDKAMLRHGMLDPRTPFLPKPFSTHALLRKVREVLGAPWPMAA